MRAFESMWTAARDAVFGALRATSLAIATAVNGEGVEVTGSVDNVGLHLTNEGTGGLDISLQSTGGTSGWGQGVLVVASGAGAGTEVLLAIDKSSTADETRLMLFDVSAGTVKRVYRGPADSGGAGYRVLRVLN
jgi:hypothetical protein